MFIIRHGDVLIKEINTLPKKLNKLNTNIVMEGEQTGHHHRIVATMPDLEMYCDETGRKYFKLNKNSEKPS